MLCSRNTVTKEVRRRRGITPFFVFVFPALLAVGIIIFYPAVYAIAISFTDRHLLYLGFTRFVGVRNYIEMIKDKNFWHSLRLMLGFLGIALPIEIVIGFSVALLFTNNFPLNRIMRSLLMLPVFVLPVLSGLTWRLMLQPRYGVLAEFFRSLSIGPIAWLADPKYAYLAILLQDIWRMWPFVFIIVYAGLTSLPAEFVEASLVDGASFFQRLWYVIIPCMKPVIATAFLLRMIDALRIFSEVYVMTYGGPSNATMLLSLYIHKQAFEFGKISYASTIAVFLLLIALGISYFVVKRMMRGEVS
ncbi:carbohydrate ABC transporter permease [Pseudothermotoga thermarum]|uniref:Binding-protein-dependent transport systems inner membrane component n=1 Tax=Pseudothermotoga thermarum DSM 5069 TaxID=688269 RepID=F7YVY1_9THEM|nr:sugar ABC transporter permease [Pseudothermotoga thermarum]AEH51810.1 binding-protein-dependent transport systems inner membrane component [Pseudothermotoga thermarum DSM 5069]